MKSLTTKILVGVLSVLLFATIGSQIYYKINDKHDTEEAELCNINEDITFQGIIIRDEKVFKNMTEREFLIISIKTVIRSLLTAQLQMYILHWMI